ncbi:MAG: hypothetical protein QXD23_02645 [Candidatus Micrarchaeaceae archaeon]
MNHTIKEANLKKKLVELLFSLKSSFVVVEGKHDLYTLNKIGIKAHTYESVMRSKTLPSNEVILLFDNDKRGKEREEQLSSFLSCENIKINNSTGKLLLKILNTVHVEGIITPIERIFENVI